MYVTILERKYIYALICKKMQLKNYKQVKIEIVVCSYLYVNNIFSFNLRLLSNAEINCILERTEC